MLVMTTMSLNMVPFDQSYFNGSRNWACSYVDLELLVFYFEYTGEFHQMQTFDRHADFFFTYKDKMYIADVTICSASNNFIHLETDLPCKIEFTELCEYLRNVFVELKSFAAASLSESESFKSGISPLVDVDSLVKSHGSDWLQYVYRASHAIP